MASKVPTKTPAKKPKPKSTAAKTSDKSGSENSGSSAKNTSSSGSSPKSVARPVSARPAPATKTKPTFVPRAMASLDDDDVLMATGGGGAGFGRCGGRLLSNKLEQQLCSRLGIAGVVHSHSPRHYEIRYSEGQVAAYAPMVVLRGRGREGKSVVIEAVEESDAPILRKIIAFRAQYGQEFYVILVAADEVLDDVPLASYDESCSATNVNTLIARLAE